MNEITLNNRLILVENLTINFDKNEICIVENDVYSESYSFFAQMLFNFTMDKRGSLFKRMGFGKLNAVSEIFNMFKELPDTKAIGESIDNPELTNDNIVYMKMLVNDNNCFRNLSAYSGDKAYRKYQEIS